MLADDFFHINTIDSLPESIEAEIKLNASHNIYMGHFPNNPITPGVVQLQIVKELLEISTQEKRVLKEVGRCKFLAILNPIDTPTIRIKIKISKIETIYKISAQGLSSDLEQTFFKFSAKYS